MLTGNYLTLKYLSERMRTYKTFNRPGRGFKNLSMSVNPITTPIFEPPSDVVKPSSTLTVNTTSPIENSVGRWESDTPVSVKPFVEFARPAVV